MGIFMENYNNNNDYNMYNYIDSEFLNNNNNLNGNENNNLNYTNSSNFDENKNVNPEFLKDDNANNNEFKEIILKIWGNRKF